MKRQQREMYVGFSVYRNSEKLSEDPATAKLSDHARFGYLVLEIALLHSSVWFRVPNEAPRD